MENKEYHILDFRADYHGVRGRLYYYQGNFFYPLSLSKMGPGILERGIRQFTKDHKAMIDRDRKDPSYRSIGELVDLKPGCV